LYCGLLNRHLRYKPEGPALELVNKLQHFRQITRKLQIQLHSWAGGIYSAHGPPYQSCDYTEQGAMTRLAKTVYMHRIYMVLANPSNDAKQFPCLNGLNLNVEFMHGGKERHSRDQMSSQSFFSFQQHLHAESGWPCLVAQLPQLSQQPTSVIGPPPPVGRLRFFGASCGISEISYTLYVCVWSMCACPYGLSMFSRVLYLLPV